MSETLDIDLTLTDDPDQQNEVFLNAFNSGKGAIFDQLYRDDAVSNLTGTPLTGTARTQAITELLATNPKLTSRVLHAFRTTDTILLIVRFHLEIPTPDAPDGIHKIDGICTDVLVHDTNGNWIMAVDRPVADEPTT